ncbi:MAG: hypothetical protein Q9226_007084 [Calogaya cf. arnoldii]
MAAQSYSNDPAQSSSTLPGHHLLLVLTKDRLAKVLFGILDLFEETEDVWDEALPDFFADSTTSRKQFLSELVEWLKETIGKETDGEKWRETMQATLSLYLPTAEELLEEAEQEEKEQEEEEEQKETDVKGKGKAP